MNRDLAVKKLSEVHKHGKGIERLIFQKFQNSLCEYNRKVRNLLEWLSIFKPRKSYKVFCTWNEDDWKRHCKPVGKQHTEWVIETMPKEIKPQEGTVYKCRECNKNSVTFYLKQTRSADEPMTRFNTCTACGEEWRSSA